MQQFPHKSWFMYSVQVEKLKRLSIGGGDGGGGGGGGGGLCLRPGMVC